jgi:transposase
MRTVAANRRSAGDAWYAPDACFAGQVPNYAGGSIAGLLYGFGVTFRSGRQAGLNEIRARMAELEDALPGVLICGLQDQLNRIDGLEQDINQLEKRIGTWQKQDAACRAIAKVPGIGKLTATALVAMMGYAKTFKSGREFASFLGLVPRHSGTGGKIGGMISKRATHTCARS